MSQTLGESALARLAASMRDADAHVRMAAARALDECEALPPPSVRSPLPAPARSWSMRSPTATATRASSPAGRSIASVARRSAWVFAALCAVLACGDTRSTPADSPAALPTQAASPAATLTAEGRAAAQPELDPQTGLVVDPRAPLVAATCTGCHSAKLVTQNRGTRKDWDERLRWMQKNHNLWDLETGVRDTILDYLSEHYAPEEPSGRLRRAPLPAHLRPPTAAELAAASQRTGS